MNERLIALADAADAVCPTDTLEFADFRSSVQDRWDRPMHYRHGGEVGRFCKSWGVRKIVEREHPGLGSQPTSEWRRLAATPADQGVGG